MSRDVRLTAFSHGAGCACKLGPADLVDVLSRLETPAIPEELLVSADTGDDAAVYLLPGDGARTALVATVDFFTPIVDDAYDWGRIAAANALSDIYAMGGTPALALNLVSWPPDDLPLELLARVLQGGHDVAAKAGTVVAGGHSITDPEPKYGMAAFGFVEAARVVRNSTAPAGARLFLTKPIGLGLITTAIKAGRASDAQARTAIDAMTTLNAAASRAMADAGADAATDVTGFGLLGHLQRMLEASGVAAAVDASAVPLLEGVVELARRGLAPGGTRRNHAFVRRRVDWGTLPEPEQLVLADAQTSGGLLIAARDGDALADALSAAGISWSEIGVTTEGAAGTIAVTGRLRSR